jgi:hypothetical protein
MLPELKEWETNTPKGAPKLILVSDGTVEANREQGFRSPVVLEDGYRVSDAYGVPGTPSAVLVDAGGSRRLHSDRRRPGGHAVSGGSLKRNRRIV